MIDTMILEDIKNKFTAFLVFGRIADDVQEIAYYEQARMEFLEQEQEEDIHLAWDRGDTIGLDMAGTLYIRPVSNRQTRSTRRAALIEALDEFIESGGKISISWAWNGRERGGVACFTTPEGMKHSEDYSRGNMRWTHSIDANPYSLRFGSAKFRALESLAARLRD